MGPNRSNEIKLQYGEDFVLFAKSVIFNNTRWNIAGVTELAREIFWHISYDGREEEMCYSDTWVSKLN